MYINSLARLKEILGTDDRQPFALSRLAALIDNLDRDPDRAREPKENRVILGIAKPGRCQQGPRDRIHIGMGICDLWVFTQDL